MPVDAAPHYGIWSIADKSLSRASSSSSWTEGTEDTSVKLRIAIRGYANNAPTLATAIPDQVAVAGQAFSYTFPANTFTDADNDPLTYSAERSDGTALPSWLTFTPGTRTFAGLPAAADAGRLAVKVIASDGTDEVSDTFDITVAVTDVCHRTPQVRDAIVGAVTGVTACADLTVAHLAGITTLDLSSQSLASLVAGDFAGLTGLTTLDLGSNSLTSLPANIFDRLTELRRLFLNANSLNMLPESVFDNLTNLTLLHLVGNPGAPFKPGANAGEDQTAATTATVNLAGAATGPWGDNVTWQWTQVDGASSTTAVTGSGAVTVANATTATPSFTAPATAATLYFRLVVTPVPGAVIASSIAAGDPDWVTVTVREARTTPTLSVSVDDNSISEASGTATVTVSTGSGPTFTNDETITLTLGGTATLNTDYTINSTSLTLTAGSSTVTATVTAVQDIIDDNSETVVITASHGGNTIGSVQTVTIEDDDARPELLMWADTESIAEAGGRLRVRVGTARSTYSTNQTIEFKFIGTALPGSDFTTSPGLTPGRSNPRAAPNDFRRAAAHLTLPAGSGMRSSYATLVVTATHDIIDEFDETIIVRARHSESGRFIASHRVTIPDDDDAPSISASWDNSSIAEAGGTATLTLSTVGGTFGSDRTFSVRVSGTATKTDDFTRSPTGDLVLPAGSGGRLSTATLAVTAVQDVIDDNAETVVVHLRDSGGRTVSGSSQTITITDDDAAPTLSVSLDNDRIVEAGGTSVLTVSTGGTAYASNRTITLALSGTATRNTDYTIDSTSLTLPAGSTSVTATVTALVDVVNESNETVVITASQGGSTIGSAQTVTIVNNASPQPFLTVSVNNAGIAEAAGASTVTVSTGSGPTFDSAQTIALSLSGTATRNTDYTIDSTSLTLPANSSSVTATVTAVQDIIDEPNETVIITASHGVNTIGSPLTVTIADDDAAPTLSASWNNSTIAEAGGIATLTVSTGGTAYTSDQTITLSLSDPPPLFSGSAPPTAARWTDYAINSTTLTLAAGSTSVTATVTAEQDILDEVDEMVIITASHRGNRIGSPQTITITDDDAAPTLSVSVDNSSIAEAGGTATLTVRTGGTAYALDQRIALSLSGTATETADYTIDSRSLRFHNGEPGLRIGTGETSVKVTVTAVQDTEDEPNETVVIEASRVRLEFLEPGPFLTQTTIRDIGSQTITIIDDDATVDNRNRRRTRGVGPEVSFADLPEGHDGQSGFKLRVRFSGAPSGLSPKTDAASVLEVEGGTVTGAKAETKDADSPWSVTIEPDGNGDVTVRVPVRACTEPNAVCIGGQPITEAAEATVPGPAPVGCPAPALTGGAELVWTGQIGIEKWPGNAFYGFGNGVRGTLDDRDFTLGANEYLIDHVTQRNGRSGPLLFSLESALTAEEKRTLVLHACEDGTRLRLADASGPSRHQTYRWNGTGGLDWSGETERTLHLVRDAAAPEFASAAVDGAALALSFGEALDEGAVPATSAFAVTVGGDARAVDAVEVAGSAVTLTLASAVTAADTVTVAYTAPAANAPGLRDALGNRVADITAAAVTNGTAAALPAVSIAPGTTPVHGRGRGDDGVRRGPDRDGERPRFAVDRRRRDRDTARAPDRGDGDGGDSRAPGGLGGRRAGERGLGRAAALHGAARPGGGWSGDGALRDLGRHGAGGRGLCGAPRRGALRAGRDREDGRDRGFAGQPQRGQREHDARALAPVRGGARGRRGDGDDLEHRPDTGGVACAVRAHGGRAGHRGGGDALRSAALRGLRRHARGAGASGERGR